MFSDRNHTCCFTGHRIIEERHRPLLPGLLEAALRELIAELMNMREVWRHANSPGN